MKFLQILVLILDLSFFASAQKTTLSGKVYDQAGSIISETKISLTDKEGKKFETFTNDIGFYQIMISPGTYLLEAEYMKHQAWKKFRVEKYEVASDIKMTLDIVLRVDEDYTKKYGNDIIGKPKRIKNKMRRGKIN